MPVPWLLTVSTGRMHDVHIKASQHCCGDQCVLARQSVAGAPEAKLMAKKRQKSVRGLALGNMPLMVSLNAKLNACVGKYLRAIMPTEAHCGLSLQALCQQNGMHAGHAVPKHCVGMPLHHA